MDSNVSHSAWHIVGLLKTLNFLFGWIGERQMPLDQEFLGASMLDNLTLIIPTYCRHDYILRALKYWKNSDLSIIVLDGSPHSLKDVHLENAKCRVTYIHNPVGFYNRISMALDLVATDYVMLACDDEFFIPSALARCVTELEADPELIACCGRALGFGIGERNIWGVQVYPSMKNLSLEHGNAVVRLNEHMAGYVPSLIYAVSKVDPWRKCMNSVVAKEFHFYGAAELQFEMLMSFAGKSKVIPQLMWMRSIDEAPAIRGTDPSLDTQNKFVSWWSNEEKLAEHEAFTLHMASSFADLDPMTDETCARDILTEGVRGYLNVVKSGLQKTRRKLVIRRIATFVLGDKLFGGLKFVIKNANLRRTRSQVGLIEAANVLITEGVAVDFFELERICVILKDFHGIDP